MSEGSRGLDLLTLVHRHPGITRAEAARRLGIGSGQATEITSRLVGDELIDELPSAPTGARGRPSTVLVAHGAGPLVLCVALDHESWQVSVVGVGSEIVDSRHGSHDRQVEPTLAAIGEAATSLRRAYRKRIRATAVSVPGTVRDDVVLQAAGIGWTDVSVASLRPRRSKLPFVVGNDASFAALGEARRGVGLGVRSMLHLYFDSGLGGALVEDGRLITGASGNAGEFGHLPFGDPNRVCPCGARGCWNTSIDGSALARNLGRPAPVEGSSFMARVIEAGRGGDVDAVLALEPIATAVGRGIAGLVNALDPALISVSGHGGRLLDWPGRPLERGFLEGLMDSQRRTPPPLVVGALGSDAPLIGAAEECFDRVLTPAQLALWSVR